MCVKNFVSLFVGVEMHETIRFKHLLSLAMAVGVSHASFAQSLPELPSGWTPKEIVFTNKDMVVAANALAMDDGVEVLRASGAAIDAAIAVQMVLDLVEPQSSGIGGGACLLYYDGTLKISKLTMAAKPRALLPRANYF